MIQKILRSTDSKLRLKSRPIAQIDKRVAKLVQDLKDTLAVQKSPEGVGLAAPQIGINLRVFLASYKKFKRIVINPEILKESKSKVRTKDSEGEILEGCLSVPNYYGPLKRSVSVKVKYLNEKGEEVIEEFRNFEAQVILHEIDHLNGVLFIDHILKEKRPLYKLINNKWEEVEI